MNGPFFAQSHKPLVTPISGKIVELSFSIVTLIGLVNISLHYY
ncbi:hypothetical protein LINPERPRIM_LOCUS7499 [Linum perenne]